MAKSKDQRMHEWITNPENNDFLKLVCVGNNSVDENDLKLLLEKRLEMVKQMYGWFFSSILVGVLGAVATLISQHYFASLGTYNEIYLAMSAIVALTVLALVIQLTARQLTGSVRPLVAQRNIMMQYIYAKAVLHSCKIQGE